MNNVTTKIIVAFVLLAVFAGGTFYIYGKLGVLKSAEMPCKQLAQIPKELGSWKGQDRPTEDRVFRAIGADNVLNRTYTNLAGKEITLHAAVRSDFPGILPHTPMVCYPSAGWIEKKASEEKLEMPGLPPVDAMFATFEMEGRRTMILFWYQFGEPTFHTSEGFDEAKQKLRHYEKWPCLIKVLLQTDMNNSEQAKKRLLDFASHLYPWTSQMQYGDAGPPPTDPAD
ncbi:MAG: EpsI family protein [Pirellulales bacterium]|nr:EpsI family protein [Pirellulales bacterium]